MSIYPTITVLYYLVLVLEDVLCVDGVPDADLARLVGGGDVEPGGGVAGAQNLAGVLGVNVRVLRRVEGPDDDRVSVGVEEVLPVGGSGEGEGLPAHRPRQHRQRQTVVHPRYC